MKLKSLFLIALASIGFAGTANAALIPATWTDTYDVGTGIVVDKDGYSYFHDLTLAGFEVGSDLVTNFTLSIDLFDDDKKDGFELAFVDIAGILGDSFVTNFGVDAYQGWSIVGLIELNLLGTLSVTIDSVCLFSCGDFIFAGSELVAHGYTSKVPEPGTLGMLGMGLLGVSLAARRRKVKKS
jgi:hypothetical protein